MGNKDYYAILKIPKDASIKEIKRAYRKIAKETHPDKVLGNESIFEEATEAYNVLTDERKRSEHDESLNSTAKRKRKGSDLAIRLKVYTKEIIDEVTKSVKTYHNDQCPKCMGTGSTEKRLFLCTKCNGSGIDAISRIMGPQRFCQNCKGYGNISKGNCLECGGKGIISRIITRSFKLSRAQSKIIIPKSGNYSLGSKTPGNLIITIDVENDSLYEIYGDNIKGYLSISPVQAILGDTVHLKVFEKIVEFDIPAGTEHNKVVEKENAGFNKGPDKGSLFMKIKIEIPNQITDQEKKLYTQLLQIEKGVTQ